MEKDFLTKAIRKTAEKKESDVYSKIDSDFRNSHLRELVLSIWDQKISIKSIIDWSFRSQSMTTNLQELRELKKWEIEQAETTNLLDKISNINYVLQNMDQQF